MTTAIIVTDKEGHYRFKPTAAMIDSNTNHCRMFEEITEDSCLLIDRYTWDSMYSEYPPHENCEIFIGVSISDIRKIRPFRHLVVAGNMITLENLDQIDTLLVFQYDEPLDEEHLFGPETFPLPSKRPKVIGVAPKYRILRYELKCQKNFENQSNISTTLAVANSVNLLHTALMKPL